MLRPGRMTRRDVREHHAVAAQERQSVLLRAAGLHELGVALQRVDHLDAMPRLGQRIDDGLGIVVGQAAPAQGRGALSSRQSLVSTISRPLRGCNDDESGCVCFGPMGTSYQSR